MPALLHSLTDIARCAAQYRTDKLAPLGLKGCHASYLLQIAAAPGISQDQLAGRIFINKSNVARQLAILEEEGFVLRRASEEDKRVTCLYPSEKTLAVLPEIRAALGTWEALVTVDLSAQERDLLIALLHRVKLRAEALPEVE